MKSNSLVLIPLTFVAGVVSVVLLQQADVIQIGQSTSQINSGPERFVPPAVVATASAPSASDNGQEFQQLGLRIDTLQRQLRDSTLNADELQLRVGELEEKLESALLDSTFLPSGEPAGEQGNDLAVEPNQTNRSGRGFGFGGPNDDDQFENLVAAGVDPVVAEEIKRQSDLWALQRLELIDQATREGWRRSDEFGERLDALREQQPSIRDELGDDSYDRFLFESGGSNRVAVSSIINGSAAQLAGIQNGDVVVSYADSRVFSMRELQQSTREGARGESVQVQVLREGEIISVDLPRGPLGVTLSGSRVEP